jgi:RNA polymerase sigma factor (TIGR02999 family)
MHLVPAERNPTELLRAWGGGDAAALEQLVPLVHDELRRLAQRYMNRERAGHTLQPTALVNELYLKLVDVKAVHWQNRAHFFAMAARLMRRILVDMARARKNQKRGGGVRKESIDDAVILAPEVTLDVVALDAAMQELEQHHPRKCRVVELRFFGGLTVEEVAVALNVSTDSIKRDWRFAKLWLLRELSEGQRPA